MPNDTYVREMMICPAVNRKIDLGYCIELQMATDDEIVWEGMEDTFSEQQMSVCRSCPKHGNPSPD